MVSRHTRRRSSGECPHRTGEPDRQTSCYLPQERCRLAPSHAGDAAACFATQPSGARRRYFRLYGFNGQGPAALRDVLRREAEGWLQMVRRGEEAGIVSIRLRPLLHHLWLLRPDREERGNGERLL